MPTPRTSVDERFSDPGATATSWEEARRMLESAELSWIVTVRADGRPHVTPLVAVWTDGAMHFCTGDKEQKACNLAANPHVVVMTGRNDWDQGMDVVVEGDAIRVTDAASLARLAAAWAPKWDGRWQYVVGEGCFHHPGDTGDPRETILVYAVAPEKVLAFTKGNFSHTRHRF